MLIEENKTGMADKQAISNDLSPCSLCSDILVGQ
jgi:hypothetical protein